MNPKTARLVRSFAVAKILMMMILHTNQKMVMNCHFKNFVLKKRGMLLRRISGIRITMGSSVLLSLKNQFS